MKVLLASWLTAMAIAALVTPRDVDCPWSAYFVGMAICGASIVGVVWATVALWTWALT